jgi:hypothetical protein
MRSGRDALWQAAVSGTRLYLTSPSSHLDSHSSLDHHQLSIILDILGTPSLDDFYAITSQRSREYIRALPFRKKKPFSTLFPNANPLVCETVQ